MSCPHNKKKYYCKECGGSGICPHNKQKHTCVDCKGSQICEHNKNKRYCKECGGAEICEHNKFKKQCKECKGNCKGTKICEHNKFKKQCKECKGSQICEHDKYKPTCKECKGSAFCKHGKQRPKCKDCGGSAFCEHGIQRSSCKDCGGSAFCKHDKKKRYCKECGGAALCKLDLCETRKNNKCDGYCMYCYVNLFPEQKISRNFKTKESAVIEKIKENFKDNEWKFDRVIKDGCSKKRPDCLLDMGSHIIIVEIDENKHNSYDCSCENKRIMLLSIDVYHRPIVFLRFNPDANDTSPSCWKINSKTGISFIKNKEEWNLRISSLIDLIKYWKENVPEKLIEIIELYY